MNKMTWAPATRGVGPFQNKTIQSHHDYFGPFPCLYHGKHKTGSSPEGDGQKATHSDFKNGDSVIAQVVLFAYDFDASNNTSKQFFTLNFEKIFKMRKDSPWGETTGVMKPTPQPFTRPLGVRGSESQSLSPYLAKYPHTGIDHSRIIRTSLLHHSSGKKDVRGPPAELFLIFWGKFCKYLPY